MYRIIDGRGTGKTSRLMLLAKETGGCIICGNPLAMKQKALNYGLTGIEFYSYGDLLSGKLNKQGERKPLYIDELDGFLTSINFDIDGYTLSEE